MLSTQYVALLGHRWYEVPIMRDGTDVNGKIARLNRKHYTARNVVFRATDAEHVLLRQLAERRGTTRSRLLRDLIRRSAKEDEQDRTQ